MQVFKLFFKIFRSFTGTMIMYIVIFLTVANIVANANSSESTLDYENTKVKVTVKDNDNSAASRALADYLCDNNTPVEINDYSVETMQDELYNRNTNAVIFINEGFEENILAGNTDGIVDIYNIPGTMNSAIVDRQVNNYIHTVSAFIAADMDLTSAIAASNDTVGQSADINVINKPTKVGSKLSIYLTYIAYVFMAMAITGVSPLILVINDHELRRRFNCSSYKSGRLNTELALSTGTVGLGICLLFSLFIVFNYADEVLNTTGALCLLNMIIYMLVSLSIAYLVGNLAPNLNMVNMFANIIGLGFSFIGGVFVPLEVMSDGIVKIAHFLPSYWYVITKEKILGLGTESTGVEIAQCMGIMLIFAAAFFMIAVAVQRNKRTEA